MGKQEQKIVANETDNSLKGISTGFKQLDKITRGLQAGELIFLAGRPGMGKTTFAINLVENVSIRVEKTCAVFSLELPRGEIVPRLICAYSNINLQKALDGKLGTDEWKRLMIAKEKIASSNVYIDDSTHIAPEEILSKCRQLKTNGQLDLVIIDYLQLVSSEKREYASVSHTLKIVAKELNVPILVLAQLRGRSLQSIEPSLSNIRELNGIEQEADVVIFLHRPDMVTQKTELIIAKNNGGNWIEFKLNLMTNI